MVITCVLGVKLRLIPCPLRKPSRLTSVVERWVGEESMGEGKEEGVPGEDGQEEPRGEEGPYTEAATSCLAAAWCSPPLPPLWWECLSAPFWEPSFAVLAKEIKCGVRGWYSTFALISSLLSDSIVSMWLTMLFSSESVVEAQTLLLLLLLGGPCSFCLLPIKGNNWSMQTSTEEMLCVELIVVTEVPEGTNGTIVVVVVVVVAASEEGAGALWCCCCCCWWW